CCVPVCYVCSKRKEYNYENVDNKSGMAWRGAARHPPENPLFPAVGRVLPARTRYGHGTAWFVRAVRICRAAAAAGRFRRRRGGYRCAQPRAAGRCGRGRFPHRIALARRPALARAAWLPTKPFSTQFQILITMAKDHFLPRYLLRAAVCLCLLLG